LGRQAANRVKAWWKFSSVSVLILNSQCPNSQQSVS
jgi:hypothetical protein